MRVAYRGKQEQFHVLEFLPRAKLFPPLRLFYHATGSRIEIDPSNRPLTEAEAFAFQYALNSLTTALNELRDTELDLMKTRKPYDMAVYCRLWMDKQNTADYDVVEDD